jgi:hypothetical protein
MMTDIFDEAIKEAENAELHDILGSTALAVVQNINFWSIAYSDKFIQSSSSLKHLYSMDAVLQASEAVGVLSVVMQEYNKGLLTTPKYAIDSEGQILHEKITYGIATLVIAAIRLAQENEIDLGRAISEEIEVQTGIDMNDALKEAVLHLIQEMMKNKEKEQDETDNK